MNWFSAFIRWWFDQKQAARQDPYGRTPTPAKLLRAVAIVGIGLLVFFLTRGERERLRAEDAARRQAGESVPAVGARDVPVEELLARRRDAAYKWFSDLDDAGAHGSAGVEPPMLIVGDHGGTVSIENISDGVIGCIVLQRGPSSCPLEAEQPGCTPLEPGGTRHYRLQGETGCGQWPIEYRIGSLEFPEVSWWSDSALARWRRELDAVEAGNEFAVDSGDARRREELLYFYETHLADVARASQWKDEQVRWKQRKSAVQVFRHGPDERGLRLAWSGVDGARLDELARAFAARHYGPAGAMPMLLEVREDEPGTVEIVNRSKYELVLGVTRAHERRTALEPAHCALSTEKYRPLPGELRVSPGASGFLYSNFEANAACTRDSGGALEFTIESERGLEWITTSRVHDYLDIGPEFVNNPVKQVSAERARRRRVAAGAAQGSKSID